MWRHRGNGIPCGLPRNGDGAGQQESCSQRGAARRCLWCPAGSARWAGSGAAAPPTAVAPPPPPPPARRTFETRSSCQVLLTGPQGPVLRSWAQVLLPAELSAQPRACACAVAGARGAAGGATGMPERRRARAWPPVQLRRPEVPTSPNAAETRRKAVEFVRALPNGTRAKAPALASPHRSTAHAPRARFSPRSLSAMSARVVRRR